MWVSSLELTNIRGFRSTTLDLSKQMNLLVGHNNSGKSTILKSIYMLQSDSLSPDDITLGETNGTIICQISDLLAIDDNIGLYSAPDREILLNSRISISFRNIGTKNVERYAEP